MTRRTLLSTLLVVLMFMAGIWALRPNVATSLPPHAVGGVGGPTMTASTQQLDHAAYLAAPGTPGEWSAQGQTDGAWLQLDQPASVVRRVVLTRAEARTPGVRGGYLRFSDGSVVHVRLRDSTTVVPVTPREVSSVRFVVSEVDPGTDQAGLGELALEGTPDGSDVDTTGPDDGNLAPLASVSPERSADVADLAPLVDGDPTTTALVGDGVQLTWKRPREITSVAVAGAVDGAALGQGSLVFSDGSRLPFGGVTHDQARPTVVSFMPRVTTTLRLDVEGSIGGDPGELSLGEISVLQRGAPAVDGSSDLDPGAASEAVAQVSATGACAASSTQARDDLGPVVLCPSVGANIGGLVDLRVAVGSSYTSVAVTGWSGEQRADGAVPSEFPEVEATVGDDHTAAVSIDVSDLPAGPMVLQVTAVGAMGSSPSTYVQLIHAEGRPAVSPEAQTPAGRSLVYAEEFDQPVTLSRDGVGADFTSGKPEIGSSTDFGDAAFLDPTSGLHPAEVVDDDYLRMRLQRLPAQTPDPMGWGRTRGGAMLASARPGGSGFSAQYGYFEARMLAPAVPGSWPAFWMLPTPNLVEPQDVVAEIDAVELYGHDPVSTCHVTHQFPDRAKVGQATCGQRWDTVQEASTWHTYGAEVLPDHTTFYVDGREVYDVATPQGGEDPMFFMVDLASGGGFPGSMIPTRGRAELYVDWVRVYV